MVGYSAIYQAALTRNIRLVNTSDQHQTAMKFDRFYPLLGDLTPKSRIVTAPDQVATAASELGFPLFVKGAVKSNKEQAGVLASRRLCSNSPRSPMACSYESDAHVGA